MSSRTCSTTLPRARTYNAPSPSTRDKAPIESVRSSLCVIGLPPRFPSNQGNHHQPRAPEERSQGSGWNLTSTTGDEGLYAPNTRMGIVLSKHEGGAVMSRKKVLVLGGNFGGLTAALAVARELRGDVDVRVVSASDHFLFNPSLIWLPFGKRRAADITILEDAIHAGEGWRRFLENPGDIVIGASQGAGCFGAAYEYLFNVSHQLRKAGIKRQVKLTYVSAEPFLGHFGIGGLPHGEALLSMFLKKEHITAVMNMAMDRVEERRLVLADGRGIEFAYAMIVPPFVGQDVIRAAGEIADEKGYVKVRDTYQTRAYDDVYAVGVAAAIDVPWQTPTPVGVPKTGFPTERMAHVAARNIAAQIRGEAPSSHEAFGDMPAVCVMDAGNNGVIILADKMLPPRKHGVLIPGPQAHAMKLAFEKYFLWKARHGYVSLP